MKLAEHIGVAAAACELSTCEFSYSKQQHQAISSERESEQAAASGSAGKSFMPVQPCQLPGARPTSVREPAYAGFLHQRPYQK